MTKSELIWKMIHQATTRKTYLYQALGEAYRTGSAALELSIINELETLDRILEINRESLRILKLATIQPVLS